MSDRFVIAIFAGMCFVVAIAGWFDKQKLANDIRMLEENAQVYDKLVEAHLAEEKRLTACAQRQIKSLINICDDNNIQLVQNLRTSEWSEGPKPLTPAELDEFRDAWMLRLETGISPMSGRPVSLDDPINAPTVALIAGLKAGRFVRESIMQTELQKAQNKITRLEEQAEVNKLAGREIHKLIKALDKFVIEHPEVAEDFPRHPFRAADGDEQEPEAAEDQPL